MSDYCAECGRPILPLVCSCRAATGPYETRAQLRGRVMELIQEGSSIAEISELLGVSPSTVSRIKHGDRTQTIHGYRVPKRPRT